MIGKLKGVVEAVGENHCLIDVNGVGYEVQASARTLRGLEVGQKAVLVIDTHVREDAIRLYGFTSEVERSWFRMLQGVQGVGAKVALSVLGVLSPADLARAIALGDWAVVERTPGVGKKLAQRITAELKDKAPPFSMIGTASPATVGGGEAMVAAAKGGSAVAEAISALVNLGYAPAQASQAVAVAVKEIGSDGETPVLIRRALKALAR